MPLVRRKAATMNKPLIERMAEVIESVLEEFDDNYDASREPGEDTFSGGALMTGSCWCDEARNVMAVYKELFPDGK
jgi:hypothetical protein